MQLALDGRRDEAIEECRRTIDLDPNFAVAYDVLGGLLAGKGMYPEALAAMQQAVALSRGNAMSLAEPRVRAGATRPRGGGAAHPAAALRGLEGALYPRARLRHRPSRVSVSDDQALGWLEKAYEERFNRLAYLRREPIWDPLRQEPRFQDLVKRISLPDEAISVSLR